MRFLFPCICIMSHLLRGTSGIHSLGLDMRSSIRIPLLPYPYNPNYMMYDNANRDPNVLP